MGIVRQSGPRALPWADMFEPFGLIVVIAFCLKGKHKSAQGNALGFLPHFDAP